MVENLYSSKHDEYYATVRHRPIEFMPASNGRLLDVGGGNGATSRFLIEKGRATSSVVVDPFSTAEDLPNVQFMKEDASVDFFEKLQAKGEQFDTVLCLDVLEHLMDPWAVLAAIKPLLKPGGTLFISLPNARFVAMTVPLVLFGRFDYKIEGVMDRTHIRWFTRATGLEMVTGAGYEICQVDAYVNKRVTWVNRLTLGLFRRFFEYQYFIRAKS